MQYYKIIRSVQSYKLYQTPAKVFLGHQGRSLSEREIQREIKHTETSVTSGHHNTHTVVPQPLFNDVIERRYEPGNVLSQLAKRHFNHMSSSHTPE